MTQHWVVVGAGSAGCVVARRLCDAGHRVTVLECGPPLTSDQFPAAIAGSDALAAAALSDRTHTNLRVRRQADGPAVPYRRGRGVGGSSAINAMVATWGPTEQYLRWRWTDINDLQAAVLLPTEPVAPSELGRLDRALLHTDARAQPVLLTRQHGRRVTAAEAYLWPVADRVEVRPNALVDRILLDDAGSATGLRLADGNSLPADRVAVCAGAVHTPAILQRSGITEGVGVGLTDHPAAGVVLQMAPQKTRGLVSATRIEDNGAQITPLNHLDAKRDDLAMLSVGLLAPRSAGGTVTITSDDPHAHPAVNLALFSDARDLDDLTAAVGDLIDLVTQLMTRGSVEAAFIDDTGTPLAELGTRIDLRAWVAKSASGYAHAASSCSAAIDAHGRVRGHEGLYIADASAFDEIPAANLALPVTLLAEHFVANWLRTD